ncbi:TKL protein kinase [Aphanomyces astaci]|uniref:TKL protein kinase n=1 Tax=Aphanomyces astaci TaxID=112090 RepID=W4GHJ1_APHAT|nr:TKL protein kinase [Aphanomyces astaci]ETV78509.1 TKL protein kinase [Aphanomyces astaci]|eukprot:XP_009832090.1 TKL protein kinase [Aphanomyces astaci]
MRLLITLLAVLNVGAQVGIPSTTRIPATTVSRTPAPTPLTSWPPSPLPTIRPTTTMLASPPPRSMSPPVMSPSPSPLLTASTTTSIPPPSLTPQLTNLSNTSNIVPPVTTELSLIQINSDRPSGSRAAAVPSPSTTSPPSSSSSSTTILLAVLCSVVTLAGVAGIYFFVYRNTAFISDYEASIVASETPCRRSSFAATMGASHYEDITTTTIEINPKQLAYVKVLGIGSMCQVWLANWSPNPAMDTISVAVKRLLPKRRNDHDVCTFLGDTRLLAVLRHPNIVAVLGLAWHTKVHIEVVLEYMDGGNLRQVLSTTNPLSMGWLGSKQEIAMDVVDALVYLHQEEIVHQKLAAETVLIHSGRRGIGAKLGNCGSMYRQPRPTSSSQRTTLSIFSPKLSPDEAHRQLQRRKWMAPEVLRGNEPTRAADMYAFGVLLSVLDTHDDPFKREAMDEALILQRVSLGDLRPTLSLLCPPFIHDIAQRCLDVSPELRPTALVVAGWLRTPGLCSPSFVSTSVVHTRRGSLPLSASSSSYNGSLPSLSMGRVPSKAEAAYNVL